MPEDDDLADPSEASERETSAPLGTEASLLKAASGHRQPEAAEAAREEQRSQHSGVTAGGEGSSVNVAASSIGGDVNIISKDEQQAYDKLYDRVLPPTECVRAQRLFVAPNGFDVTHVASNLPTGGFCLVLGSDHCGKYMAAVNLALQLKANQARQGVSLSISGYTAPSSRAFSLPRFASKAPDNRIYILRDVFEDGYAPERLHGEQAIVLDKIKDRPIYLILTSAQPPASFAEMVVPKFEIERPDPTAVLKSHLALYDGDYDGELVEAVHDLIPRVIEHFEYPIHSELFCRRLTSMPTEEISEDKILDVARGVAHVGRFARRAWFQSLSENHRLYALLVGLFAGMKGPMLNELYVRATEFLRRDGLTRLEDPRSFGMADMRDKINVRIDSDRILDPDLDVVFSLPGYGREVYEQINNYNLTLWSLRGVFIDLMREHSEPELWRFRQVLGSAIGVLCAAHRERLSAVLSEIALDGSRPVVATAGFIMAEACDREPARRLDILDLLESWIKSQRPALMWAAGAAVWRVYPDNVVASDEVDRLLGSPRSFRAGLLSVLKLLALHAKQFSEAERLKLWQGCQSLAGDPRAAFRTQIQAWKNDNYGCFVFAVQRVMALDPATMAQHLETWLLDRNGLLAWLSRASCMTLFGNGRDAEDRYPVEQRYAMLGLIHPLLKSGGGIDHGPAEEALATVRHWLEWEDCDCGRIFAALLSIANDQDNRVSFLMRRLLASFWLDSECVKAREMAQRLIVRSLALQGSPMHPPGSAHGVLVLDGSHQGMAQGISARAAVLLRALLDSQLDTSLVQLGREERLAGPEEPANTLELRRQAPRARLLIPALEKLGCDRLSLLLILSWGEVLDQADLRDCLAVDDVRLVAAGYHPGTDDRVGVFHLDSAISWADLYSLEAWLTWTRARRIASCDFAEWRPELERQLGLVEGEDLAGKLAAWAARIDDGSAARGKNDLVRLLNSAFLWWFDADPEACLGLLVAWLGGDTADSLRRIALAAGRQIFFVLAHRRCPIGTPSDERLLRCATAMVDSGWFGAEAVFYMARHLLPDPQWQRLLVDGTDDCVRPLDSWFMALIPENQKSLRQLLEVWEHRLVEEEASPDVLSEVIPRLRLRIALGSGNIRELIDSKEPYFVIVVDGAPPNAAIRRHIWQLASGVAKVLKDSSRQALIYRLGIGHPVATAQEEVSEEALYPRGLYPLPRLLVPLVESHDVTRVGAVLLIVVDEVVDGADLGDSSWVDKIKIYPVLNRASGTPFFRVPSSDVDALATQLLTA